MALGISEEKRPLWLALTGWLATTYGLDGELAWTDEDLGWVLRYRRNGRALTTLMPGAAGGFSALVVVGPSILDAALAAPLSPTTLDGLEFAAPYADGRWLWLPMTEPELVDDVETLLLIKSPPPMRPRRRATAEAVDEREGGPDVDLERAPEAELLVSAR
jgi:hypothetical protein